MFMLSTYMYKVQELYKGKLISVNMIEHWFRDGIEDAIISCDGYPLIRCVGYMSNYNDRLNTDNSNDRFSTDVVDRIILRNLEFGESSICQKQDSFYFKPEKRFLNVVFDYMSVRLVIGLYIDFSTRSVCILENDDIIMNCSLNDNYRKFLFYRYESFKEEVDVLNSSKKMIY